MCLPRLFSAIAVLLVPFFETAPALANSDFEPIEIRLVTGAPADDGALDTARSETTLDVEPETLLGPSDFVSVGNVHWTVEGDKRSPGFNVMLTPAGSLAYERISTENVGRTLAVIVDGQIVIAAKILDPVRAEGFLLTMNSEAEALSIAKMLRQVIAPDT
ncbi:hypothetical protein KUV51_17265 [Tateyamaria omphalii]|uniref:SecDF P1 head subdomain-containing protein n=1 Tax=Tateyamaria omphalii TaxID=299262 RepID=UPI001C99FD42|nr:hypothetical protein [Tateyamaria omphalii]MBY5934760.1 hypothetical protein [Tateyamaria omphalii]